ncbi:MAG TPA: aminotransferase class V-fold PLP-dependent enzyme [Kofleriaceae bacterium]|nr:aminotransferase class V-fold PLP-dependent enzyme [Kofleriaceae bacterium]
MTLDLDGIRAQFPGLATDWALCDNAGGSQILGRAADRVHAFLVGSNVQLGGAYALSELAGERVREGSRALAAQIGAADPSELVLGTSTTQLLANLALAMSFSPGDEVIVTDCDHESNIGPWRRLEARGVVVKTWSVDRESATLRQDELVPLLGPRTRLVCFTHVSNILGAVNDVAALTALVHAHGAQVCVDGVAYAPHRKLDVAAWDVDYYVFSLYKVYGPHLAALYGKRKRLLRLASLNHFFIPDDDLPYKLQPGSVPYELCHALPAVCEYLDALPFSAVKTHEARLTTRLTTWLRERRGVRLVGRAEVPTVSFTVDGVAAGEIPARVARHQVGIKSGHFYAKRLLDGLGLPGVVRASLVHYNTVGEVDRLIAALDEALP